MNFLARSFMFTLLGTLPLGALAQVGPSDPQVVASAPTYKLRAAPRKNAGTVQATLRVGMDGRVTNVQVTQTNTEGNYGEEAVKLFQSLRFRPAIDDQGRIIEGNVAMKVEFRVSTAQEPKPAPANSDPAATENEKARIKRMRCSDFNWEYQFIREQSGRDDISTEALARLSLAAYAAERAAAGTVVDALVWKNAAKAIRQTAEFCGENPAVNYYNEALKPVLDGLLAD
jgi:TonB family protein